MTARDKAKLQPIDVDGLRGKLATVETGAKENDPKALKAEIARLKAELAKKPASEVDPSATEQARRDGYVDGFREGREDGALSVRRMYGERIDRHRQAIVNAMSDLVAPLPLLPPLADALPKLTPGVAHRQVQFEAEEKNDGPARPTLTPLAAKIANVFPGAADITLPRGHRLVLTVLAQHRPRQPIMPQRRIAAIAGYSPKASTWRAILAGLRKEGFIAGAADLEITEAGMKALGTFDALPMGRALLEHWCERLPKGQREVLTVLSTIGGQGSASDVAQRAGYSTGASTWRAILAGLRTLNLIEGSRMLKLHEDLR